jgi:deoxycytidylate deaminase
MACKSDHRVKIGAVLVNKGQVLNVGYNKVGKTHPKYDWFLHAELDACLGIHRHDLTGATVYLFRLNRLGVVFNCRPCGTCQAVLKELGVRCVCYTTGNLTLTIKGDPALLDMNDNWETEPHYLEMRL